MTTTQAAIDQINIAAGANRPFLVHRLAREAWPLLIRHKKELCSVALMAVEHYENIGWKDRR